MNVSISKKIIFILFLILAVAAGHELGAGGRGVPKALHEGLQKSDVIFVIGCSCTETSFGIGMPEGKRIVPL